MSAVEPLCHLIGINFSKFAKSEVLLLEAELFARVYEELQDIFRKQYVSYFRLMRFTMEKENTMLENNFICLIIKDILSTEEYTLEGVAHYTGTHEDVVHEVISGRNTTPSAVFFKKIIELHRLVRRDLYNSVIKKITAEWKVL